MTIPGLFGYQYRIQWSGGVGKKHEIYVATYDSHLFYELFLHDKGGMAPLSPLDPLLLSTSQKKNLSKFSRWRSDNITSCSL